jgi:Ca2+/H+ antiporter
MDWSGLVGNTLWILGCAAALATISHASWEASSRSERFLSIMRLPAYRIALALAAITFCLGMGEVASSSVEAALWLLIAAVFAGYAGYLIFQIRRKG